jgi:hypothetical protein
MNLASGVYQLIYNAEFVEQLASLHKGEQQAKVIIKIGLLFLLFSKQHTSIQRST